MGFSDAFLMALGAWQNGAAEDRTRRKALGDALALEAAKLPVKYRSVSGPCFRKRFIYKSESVAFARGQIDEGVAAWTVDENYARNFKGGIRPDGSLTALFAKTPEPDEVVVSLPALWASKDFEAAVTDYLSRAGKFADALVNFKDNQGEIVLNTPLRPDDVHGLCGMPSEYDELCDRAGILDSEERDRIWKSMIQRGVYANEAWWLRKEAAQRIIQSANARLAEAAKNLQRRPTLRQQLLRSTAHVGFGRRLV